MDYGPSFHVLGSVDNSYSRILDRRVYDQEMPYGYDYGEPPAGHNNHEGKEQTYTKPRKGKR